MDLLCPEMENLCKPSNSICHILEIVTGILATSYKDADAGSEPDMEEEASDDEDEEEDDIDNCEDDDYYYSENEEEKESSGATG